MRKRDDIIRTLVFGVVILAFIVLLDGMFTGYMIGPNSFDISSYPGGIVSMQGTGTVTRSINPDSVDQGDQVQVILSVNLLSGEDFFLIDEIYPAGFVVSYNPDGMNVSEAGHLKAVEFSSPGSRTYTYNLTAPASYATYTFQRGSEVGTYQIEGMSSPAAIGGENSVTVAFQASPEICDNVDNDGVNGIDDGCDDDGDTYADASMTCVGSFLDGSSPRQIRSCASNGGDCNDASSGGFYINPGSNLYCDCNSGTGGGATQGTAEVCGDGIDQDCDGADLQCCSITSAAWNETFVWDWQKVKLTVQGNAQCTSQTVYLWLYESDGPTSNRVTSVDLGTITLSGGVGSKEWTPVWIRDTGDLDEDPEYFFKANLTTGSSDTSDNLRVGTDDEDKDGHLDVDDCNDANVNIGECTGCAVCSDPAGDTGTCVGGSSCTDITCSGGCDFGTCGQYEIPQFSSPTEPASCTVVSDHGTCGPTQCVNYNCIYDIGCESDDDNDGIPNPNDDCPNTGAIHASIVNARGCPMPTVTEFTPSLTTDFMTANLLNLTNMTLGITSMGEVKFLGNTTIVSYSTINSRYEPVDVDSKVDIQGTLITVDTVPPTGMTMVQNKQSILKLYELTYANPVLWKDSAICLNCQILDPAKYSGGPGNPDTLEFWVPGFTTYEAKNSYCGDNYCYQGGGLENCFTCPADCGVCPCDDDDNDGWGECPYCGTVNATCTYDGDDCNDGDGSINPGATEIVYNGVNDDCDPLTRDYDIDGDLSNATGFGGSDCNDNDDTIGECTGCAVCSDPTGLSGTCQPDNTQCVINCPTNDPCDYGTCNSTSYATFASPTEPGTCTVTSGDGTCGGGQCQNYQCILDIPGCSADDDIDGVYNRNDECPNTQGTDRLDVNILGCPKPLWALFTPDLTTNFTSANLSSIQNMTLGVTSRGQIKFIGNTMLLTYITADSRYTRVNLDAYVNISQNFISVDGTALPMLDKPSIVRLFNLALTRPVVLKNGALCGSDCSIIQYLGGSNLSFSVTGFTTYSTIEHYCGDGRCDDDLGETCTCSDCPACPSDDGGSTSGPSGVGSTTDCGKKPIQPCLLAVWEGWPNCRWDTSQCAGASLNCSAGEMRCAGDYLQRCEERSPASWYPIKMCVYGCNVTSFTCNAFLSRCQEKWVCQQWSECNEGSQTRLCFDENECNTFYDKPLEVKACGPGLFTGMDTTLVTVVIMFVIVISSVLIAVLILKLRNKRLVMEAASPYHIEESPSVQHHYR